MLHSAEQSGAPEIEEVVAFLRVAETGSFTTAGQRLGVPKSTVSRRVARLEDKLGVQLLHRTTRALNLTEAGTLYHERAGRALAGLEEATQAAREGRETPRGHLRITAPNDIGAGSLASIVAALFAPFYQLLIWGVEPAVLPITVMSLLLVWRHEGNIRKLLSGTESRIGQKAAAAGPVKPGSHTHHAHHDHTHGHHKGHK